MKSVTRHKRQWFPFVCCLLAACVLISFSGCFAGADYENKQVYTYRSKGANVFNDFRGTRANQSSPQDHSSETADEILYRIIDTEIKRSGQLVYAGISQRTIHAEASKLKQFFPELRIAVEHEPFPNWPKSYLDASFRYEKTPYPLELEYLDESCCPDEYKVMTQEDFDTIISDFCAGHYDLLLSSGSSFDVAREFKSRNDASAERPPVMEKMPYRIKSDVVGAKWKQINGIWRAKSHGGYALEPADPKAVQIIENLFGEK